jgi:hypothetical protein
MKINFILLKRSLIAVLGLIAVYYLITLSVALISQPSNIENNFSSISNAQYVAPSGVQQSFQPSSTGFDYRVVGYRASNNQASVFVQKNNQTYVVQQGELLENKYKLISVDSKVAIFNHNGKSFQLSTNLKIDN